MILLKSNLQANFKLLNKLGEPPAFSAFEILDTVMIELAWNLTVNKRFIINQTDLFGLTYLHKAVSESNLQAIDNFIKSVGAHRTIKCTHVEKQTPLHFACRENNFECFKKILHYQPSAIYIPDKNGCLPIHRVKSVEILKYFINFDHTMIKEKNKVNYRSIIKCDRASSQSSIDSDIQVIDREINSIPLRAENHTEMEINLQKEKGNCFLF